MEQLAIVEMSLPLALASGSLGIAALAYAWLIERALDLKLVPV